MSNGKKSKSILLFLCFLVLDISILCASMILQTAQETSASIQEKTGAKLVLECKGKYTIPIVLADRIAELPNVTEVNRSALYTAYLPGLMPVTDSAVQTRLTALLRYVGMTGRIWTAHLLKGNTGCWRELPSHRRTAV